MNNDEIKLKIIADYIKCETSLARFFRRAWEVLEPRTPLLWNWHIDYLCEHLEAVELGQIKRLLINMPPRNVKSKLVTTVYPTWVWGPLKKPHVKFLAASYSQSLSTQHSVDRRRLIESPWYQEGYSARFQISSDQNVKTEFTNTKSGSMIATSITGTVTGKGTNRLIIDDPQNPKEADSETERMSSNDTYDKTFPSRLDNKKEDVIIGVMQRLHMDDWTGHVKEQEDWVHIILPAEEQRYQKLIFPMSGKVMERNPGDLLHPEREGTKELEALRRTMGTRLFQAQYNQVPMVAEGVLIKRSWWRKYKVIPERFDQIIQAWDFAVKEKERNDFTVGTVWGRLGADKYLLDRFKARVDFPAQCNAVINMSIRWPQAYKKLIESKANGPAVVQTLRKQVSGLVEVEPKGDKVARVSAIGPEIEAGNVWIPHEDICDWTEDFLDEWSAFPDGTFDDQVDSATYAIDELRRGGVFYEPMAGHGMGVVY